jgi:probable HAF family extracellular repeat protein
MQWRKIRPRATSPVVRLSSRRLALETLEGRCLLSYTISDLGTLGGNFSYGFAINANGQVAGYSQTADFTVNGFLAQDGQGMMALIPYPQGGSNSRAYALNGAGVAAGSSDDDPNGQNQHATLWAGTTGTDLGTLGGPVSVAYGINNLGQVVGGSDVDVPFTFHAFLFDGTTMNDLGTLGGNFSQAFAINDAGQVVGYSSLPNGTQHAFLYPDDQGNLIDLGTLGGSFSEATAINQLGDVVGVAATAGQNLQHAFLYTSSTGMTDLGALGAFSEALGLNNLDQVVGISSNQAFYYDGTSMIPLNSLLPDGSGWNLLAATGINDSGQITGYGTTADGSTHAFIMSPDDGPTLPRRPDHVSLAMPDPFSRGSFAPPAGTDSQSVHESGSIKNRSYDATRQTAPAELARVLGARDGGGSTNLFSDPLEIHRLQPVNMSEQQAL